MSAAVCRKRAFVDDISPSTSPVHNKKHRYSYGGLSGSTPGAAVPISALLDQLRVDFPTMSTQVIERALVDCGYDIEATIRRLDELRLSCAGGNSAAVEDHAGVTNGSTPTEEPPVPLPDASLHENLPVNGAEWVELLVREMTGATSIDDAKSRAARVLEGLEKSINARSDAENYFQKCMKMKEKNDILLQENACLKRAVVIFAERQKDYDSKKLEVEQLKQMADQYKSQLSALEVKNYALRMYLQQAQQTNSIHGRFPDVF